MRTAAGGALTATETGNSAGAGARRTADTAAGTASAARQQAGASPFAGIGILPPAQQAWLGPAGMAHSGAAQEKDRAAASIKPKALRVIIQSIARNGTSRKRRPMTEV